MPGMQRSLLVPAALVVFATALPAATPEKEAVN